MGGRPLPPLTPPSHAHDDLAAIVGAALSAVSASSLLRRALHGAAAPITFDRPYTLIAAGKASAAMLERWYALVPQAPVRAVGVGTHDAQRAPSGVTWFTGGHPTPTPASVRAAEAALAAARAVASGERLVVLLSGGASALLSSPAPGLTLADKQQITRALMHDGRAIDELNCVRKHVSSIKGGRLAAACAGETVTLAISDVVAPIEDDPSVIGSGPTVPDPSTYADAWRIVSGIAAQDQVPSAVRTWLARGVAGEISESPKPGDATFTRARYVLIGTRHVAMEGAGSEAARRGYAIDTLSAPVVGEARDAGAAHAATALRIVGTRPGPICLVSSGETTVTVRGTGRGGRNQEFVAGALDVLASASRPMLLASVGTDGIDGPTDAAGAWADPRTLAHANEQGPNWRAQLDDNNAHALHQRLGTLLRTGPTDTNVGDLQIVLIY